MEWHGRRYDRQNPTAADIPNQAINHAATFVEAAADIAVAAVGALPPLGFIHEESSNAFTLDIADLWRVEITFPLAFSVAARVIKDPVWSWNAKCVSKRTAVPKRQLIPAMIHRIKELLSIDGDDSGSDA